eukprot:gnl/Ergobibamus_cyprinoides/2135.p2 GENE.gnl/Ergobibamus_cyprinoides/2135~~gnl/Ergobibamus_cyprinoides/2135.p2  ORF type:complete len:259 (-),score=64.85 gnl/Ergobibamus_cyprinoides/2135:42-794(-)
MPETVSFGPALAEAADAERLPDVCLPQHCAAFSTADALAVSLPSDMALALDMACADGVVEIPVYVDRARGFAVVTCAPVRETEDILLAGHVRGPRVALGAAQVLLRQEPPVSPRARPPPTYSLVVWGNHVDAALQRLQDGPLSGAKAAPVALSPRVLQFPEAADIDALRHQQEALAAVSQDLDVHSMVLRPALSASDAALIECLRHGHVEVPDGLHEGHFAVCCSSSRERAPVTVRRAKDGRVIAAQIQL